MMCLMAKEWTDLGTIEHYCRMLDAYESLLTERQAEIVRFFFKEDLSLSEIADERRVSRQAVHDHLHRACEALEEYESKLHLLSKHNHLCRELKSLLNEEDPSAVKAQLSRMIDELQSTEGKDF